MIALGVLVVVIAVLGAAFALGGNGSSKESGGASGSTSAKGATSSPARGRSVGGLTPAEHAGSRSVPYAAPSPQIGAASVAGSAQGDALGTAAVAQSGVAATRVVKTGTLSLTVKKGQVQSTLSKLISITTSLGGYVSASNTDSVAGSPTGEVTLRMPVAKFETAVGEAQRLGHETSLSTTAHDVTGKVVDLSARVGALQRTRATYLTILGRATTIGQTLEVQQRVEGVQQQIEQLQGQLKVLRNQSADGTLTVDVSQAGAPVVATNPPRKAGLGHAWHISVSRFNRGFDAIVSALGPLLLALIILAVVFLVARLSLGRVRRATS
jgi:hypothetical protein